MSKNKLKNNNPKKLLIETFSIDNEAANVIIRRMHSEHVTLSCEDNILYCSHDGNKYPAQQNPGIISMVKEFQEFATMTSDKTILYYLYAKIKTLEDKIDSLERENENLNDKIRELEGKVNPYHD